MDDMMEEVKTLLVLLKTYMDGSFGTGDAIVIAKRKKWLEGGIRHMTEHLLAKLDPETYGPLADKPPERFDD
jgi:hypothetical protein